MQHRIKWGSLDSNQIMNLRHDIWFKLTLSQQRLLSVNGYSSIDLHLVPMPLFKRVTKVEYLHERMVRLKRGTFRLKTM